MEHAHLSELTLGSACLFSPIYGHSKRPNGAYFGCQDLLCPHSLFQQEGLQLKQVVLAKVLEVLQAFQFLSFRYLNQNLRAVDHFNCFPFSFLFCLMVVQKYPLLWLHQPLMLITTATINP